MRALPYRSVPIFLTLVFSGAFATCATSQDQTGGDENIEVRYFEKKLDLAQHDLETARQANRTIPNMNSKLTMLRLEHQVKYAEELLRHAAAGSDHELHRSHIRAVENDLTLAEEQLSWARKMERENAGFVRRDQVKRLELAVELARLAVQRAKQPEIMERPLLHLQWQIDRIQSQLLNLQVEFERIRSGH